MAKGTPRTALDVLKERAGCLGVFRNKLDEYDSYLIYFDGVQGSLVGKSLIFPIGSGTILSFRDTSHLDTYIETDPKTLPTNQARNLASLLQQEELELPDYAQTPASRTEQPKDITQTIKTAFPPIETEEKDRLPRQYNPEDDDDYDPRG